MKKSVCIFVTVEITATTFLTGYIGFLRDQGWDVTVATRDEGHLQQWGNSLGVRVEPIGFVRNPSPLADARALAQCVRLLRSLRPDAVLTATPKAGLLGTVAAKLAGVPVRIYQVWGLRLETSTGVLRHVLHAMELVSLKAATKVVANSHSLVSRMEELGLVRPGAVEVPGAGSSHGVDTQRFAPGVDASIDPETQRFLDEVPADLTVAFVGRLAADKGIDTLFYALHLCESRGVSVRTLLVGPREDWAGSAVEPARLHKVGSANDVRGYLAAADVLCLPSRREGFPNVVLEASAMGLPVVVSDATGCRDAVVDGETGIMVPVDDVDALAGAFIRLAENPQERSLLGSGGRRWVQEHFRQAYVWDAYANLLTTHVGAR